MSTRLYLANDATAVYAPATQKGAWDKTTGFVTMRLAQTRTGQGDRYVNTENSATANFDVLVAVFVSDPILSATTIDGTFDAIIACAESNLDADDTLHLHAWVTQGDSDTVRGTLLSDYVDATEFAVSGTVTAFTSVTIPQQTLSSVAAQAGDRIVIEVGYRAANSHTTSRTGGFSFGGRGPNDLDGSEAAIAGTTGPAPWVQFGEDLAFAATYLYTANAAAPATPGAVLGTWDIDTKADLHLARTKSGTTATRSGAETSTTNPTDVLVHRFVSDELAAQTIGAVAFDAMLRLSESATDADAFAKLHFWVMKPDGTARGTLAANLVNGAELGTSLAVRASTTLASLAVSAGDRLVLEVGARFTNVTATSKSVSSTVGQTANDIGSGPGGADTVTSTGHSGWIRLAQAVLWAADITGYAFNQCVIVG